jgi:hypothetical protein
MAKGSNTRGEGRSKIRVVMIEADLVEGELREVTQAITNALRPTPIIQRFVTAGTPVVATPGPNGEPEEVEDAEVIEEEAEETAAARPKAAPKPRRYSEPRVLNEVDLETDVSFPAFAAGKKPKTLQDRYLIAAAWYHLHREMPAISMHHVYTCFLHPLVKWPTSQVDFDQPLRALVKADRMDRGDRGQYVINTIGLADVKVLGSDNG